MSKMTLKGLGYWINPKQYKEWPRPDGTTDKRWSMVLEPSDEAKQHILDLQMKGLKNRLKRDKNENIVISFSRPVERTYNGQVKAYTPPVVYNEKGEVDNDLRIGNGSEIEVILDVYEHNVPGSKNKAVAARWEGVKVLKLVEAPTTTTEKAEDKTEAIW